MSNNNDVYEIFCNNVKYLIEKHGIYQRTLVNAINATDNSISAMLTRRNKPSLERVCAIADYFGVSVDDMLRVDLSRKNTNTPDKSEYDKPFIVEIFNPDHKNSMEIAYYNSELGWYIPGIISSEHPSGVEDKHIISIKNDSVVSLGRELNDSLLLKYMKVNNE